jgi:quercetin dioxygenase-like cupin family protein
MSFLVTDMDDPRWTKRGALHVPPGEGLVRWVSGDEYVIKATKSSTNGSLGFIDAIVPPGGGPVAHAHADQDEAFYLLSGELEFLDGDQTFVAEPGAFVFVPRNHRHRFLNIGREAVHMLFMFTPGGPEDFFVEGGDEPVPGEQPAPWPLERFMQVADLAERTGSQALPEAPPA